jgi:hypothetical protein
MYLVAGLVAMLIALLNVTLQTYRAASRNPANALRYE